MKKIIILLLLSVLFNCSHQYNFKKKALFSLKAEDIGVDVNEEQYLQNNIIWDKNNFYYRNFYSVFEENFLFLNRYKKIMHVYSDGHRVSYTNSLFKKFFYFELVSEQKAIAVMFDSKKDFAGLLSVDIKTGNSSVVASVSMTNLFSKENPSIAKLTEYVDDLSVNKSGDYVLQVLGENIISFTSNSYLRYAIPIKDVLLGIEGNSNMNFSSMFLKNGSDSCFLVYHVHNERVVTSTVIIEYDYVLKKVILNRKIDSDKGVFYGFTFNNDVIFAEYQEMQDAGVYSVYSLTSESIKRDSVFKFSQDEFPYDFSCQKKYWVGFYKKERELEFYLWN